jgi:hypothetical protein
MTMPNITLLSDEDLDTVSGGRGKVSGGQRASNRAEANGGRGGDGGFVSADRGGENENVAAGGGGGGGGGGGIVQNAEAEDD